MMPMAIDFKNRDIISITDFTREEILYSCEKAKEMRELEYSGQRHSLRNTLELRRLVQMFFEPSTRTMESFTTGIQQLGGGVSGFSGPEGTSIMKKETLRDTVGMDNINQFDAGVVRHPQDGSAQWMADASQIPIINGGDGLNEHPTQSLLDCAALYIIKKGKLDNLSIGFGGDLAHGRTVRSLSLALSNFDNINYYIIS